MLGFTNYNFPRTMQQTITSIYIFNIYKIMKQVFPVIAQYTFIILLYNKSKTPNQSLRRVGVISNCVFAMEEYIIPNNISFIN